MLHLKIKYQSQKFRAILSLLLIFVLFAISAAQLLHTHNDTSLTNETDHTECIHLTDECVICAFIAYQQVHPAQLTHPPVLLITVTESSLLRWETVNGVYKSTSHGFTNKAPPARSC